jgi:hypothetical protein
MPRRYVVVLVAGALVLLCAGLLFPGVAKVRDAAARMSCVSTFSQTGFAIHNYAAVNNDALPAGTIPHPELSPDQRLSWWVSVLPYIEQNNAYRQFDLTRGPGDPLNTVAVSNRFRILICPASDEHRYDFDDKVHHWKSATPLTHYVGIAGVGADAAALPQGHPKAGVFGYDRITKLTREGFPDGTSNTLMMIETANNPGHWAYGGTATVRAFEPGATPYIGPDRPFGGWHNRYFFWEAHRCNTGLADGSYRTFTSKTDPAVLEALATTSGQEPLPADW